MGRDIHMYILNEDDKVIARPFAAATAIMSFLVS